MPRKPSLTKKPGDRRGGARPGAGQPRKANGGRAWARKIADDPEVRAMLERQAKSDPVVALKLFEHGYGRPPQALDVAISDAEILKPGILSIVIAGGAASVTLDDDDD